MHCSALIHMTTNCTVLIAHDLVYIETPLISPRPKTICCCRPPVCNERGKGDRRILRSILAELYWYSLFLQPPQPRYRSSHRGVLTLVTVVVIQACGVVVKVVVVGVRSTWLQVMLQFSHVVEKLPLMR